MDTRRARGSRSDVSAQRLTPEIMFEVAIPLIQEIGRLVHEAFPSQWTVVLHAVAIGPVIRVSVEFEDGRNVEVALPQMVAIRIRQVRDAMYEPGKGVWSEILVTVAPEKKVSVQFNNEIEPHWYEPAPLREWFVEELALYPRDLANMPSWLIEYQTSP